MLLWPYLGDPDGINQDRKPTVLPPPGLLQLSRRHTRGQQLAQSLSEIGLYRTIEHAVSKRFGRW